MTIRIIVTEIILKPWQLFIKKCDYQLQQEIVIEVKLIPECWDRDKHHFIIEVTYESIDYGITS